MMLQYNNPEALREKGGRGDGAPWGAVVLESGGFLLSEESFRATSRVNVLLKFDRWVAGSLEIIICSGRWTCRADLSPWHTMW